MPIAAAIDTSLTRLGGTEARPLAEWTTTFHLALVVLDPFTYESSWILDTAGRILGTFAEADCRTAFVVTSSADEARSFLGPWADELLAFVDEDRSVVKAFGLTSLPAFVHINQANVIDAKAEGWDPDAWRDVAINLADSMSWQRPNIPDVGDPNPYAGTPAIP